MYLVQRAVRINNLGVRADAIGMRSVHRPLITGCIHSKAQEDM